MAVHEQVAPDIVARQVLLGGDVQGQGIRPRVARWARSVGITGFVRNTTDGVMVHAEGVARDIERFMDRLSEVLSTESAIRAETVMVTGTSAFEILESEGDLPISARVPRDRVICADCLREGLDAMDSRRQGYPFNSCATCGPRYSILSAMPFDRGRTSMEDFPRCSLCTTEYHENTDRRYHAETTSCVRCGPRIWMTDRSGNTLSGDWRSIVRGAILSGGIVGVRGVGGYQLLCDATNADAVQELRRNKRRPTKPLAVLVEDLSAAERLARLEHGDRIGLADGRNPIVIVPARASTSIAARDVHPGTADLGIMLPASLMHRLIVGDAGRPLVCTSGNREGDALEIDPEGSLRRLAGMADLWLHHDRRIIRPIDDSVVRVMAGSASTIRLARGMAPLPLSLPDESPALMAAGGQMKSAIAWHNGAQACLGPHLGDLDSVHVLERYAEHVADMQSLYGFTPNVIASDPHPDYAHHQFFRRQSAPEFCVQHHHAHVVSAMLGADLMDREVLGVAWDGTGLGRDGSVWGGEFLRATATRFERVGSLLPYRLPGGEAAVHEPWRVALSMALTVDDVSGTTLDALFERTRVRQTRCILDRDSFSPWCTSVGRLFDAAGWILLGDDCTGFDGRAGMMLESIADRTDHEQLPLSWTTGSQREILDWRPLVRELIGQRRAGISPSVIAMRFHRALASAVVKLSDRYAQLPVVLCGGVFQNRLLVELVAEAWNDRRVGGARRGRLVLPGVIPVHDGGLAAGQLGITWARLQVQANREGTSPCV